MKRSKQEIFDECLNHITKGIPCEVILNQYPEFKKDLEEMLVIAKRIQDTKDPDIPPDSLRVCIDKAMHIVKDQKSGSNKPSFEDIPLRPFSY